jgi:hypothetical protein
MRRILVILVLLIGSILLLPTVVNAADQILYVRDCDGDSSCGTAAGTSWTNPYDQLSAAEAAINRTANDDVYIYVADGTYTGVTIDAIAHGENMIYIKKATAADHGTDTGWDNAYGDGQAIIQHASSSTSLITIYLKTDYITIDGGALMGAANLVTSYGFRVKYPGNFGSNPSAGSNIAGIMLQAARIATKVTIARTAIEGYGDHTCLDGVPYACTNQGLKVNSADASGFTIDSNYFYGWQVNLGLYQVSDFTVKNNYFDGNVSGSSAHGNQLLPDGTKNLLICNNTFKNTLVAAIGMHKTTATSTGLKIYNNIVDGHQGATLTTGFGNNDSGKTDVFTGAQIHHNTFVNIAFGSRGPVNVGNLSDVATGKSYVYNNLIFGSSNPRLTNQGGTAGGVVHDYNAYLGCTGDITSATNNQVDSEATSAIFTNYGTGVYTINAEDATAIDHIIGQGKTLASPFDIDKAGVSRTAPYDIGAYDVGGSADATAPTLAEVTPVPASSSNQAPSYVFSSDEAGTVTYGGTCGNGSLSTAIVGNNTTSWALGIATYSDCTITVTDAASNASTPLAVQEFVITPVDSAAAKTIEGGVVFTTLP